MKIKSERHINNIVQVYTTHEVLEKTEYMSSIGSSTTLSNLNL